MRKMHKQPSCFHSAFHIILNTHREDECDVYTAQDHPLKITTMKGGFHARIISGGSNASEKGLSMWQT